MKLIEAGPSVESAPVIRFNLRAPWDKNRLILGVNIRSKNWWSRDESTLVNQPTNR